MQLTRSFLLGLALGLAACGKPATSADVLPEPDVAALRSVAEFPVGVAVPAGDWPASLLDSRERQDLVDRHFDSVTAENIMKMAYLQPEPGRFTFDDADVLVAWARERGKIVHGHALVWHNQAPEWMNTFEGTPDEFGNILDEHVTTVAGHYAGRLASWDVVNEAFTDEAPSGYRDTIWYRKLGPGYIERAFRAARAADAHADLYYNDYGISGASGSHKLDRILEMVDDFRQRGVPLDGIGFQMHVDHDSPDAAAIRAAFQKVVDRGLKVRLSELDVAVNASEKYSSLSTELAELQKEKFEEIARLYRDVVPPLQHGGITVWGITDGDSWIPGFKDRPDWPLLFTADFRAKPALAGFAAGLEDDGAVAAFEWFEYRGSDPDFDQDLAPTDYRNPVAAGFFPDPSIVRRGDDYYMVHSSFAYLPGVPVLHSRNLADWELVGHVLTRPTQADFAGLGVSRGIFAPTIRYHDGLFYMITTAVDAGGNFYATATDPAGPWSDPVWLPEIDGIDPDLFFDDDGRAWLAHNGPPPGEPLYDGHRAIWLWEFDPEQGRVRPESGRIIVNGGTDLDAKPVWIEGPHLYRRDGWYYLICAEGGTGDEHSQVVFRARELDQPFLPWDGNPILTQRDLDPARANPVSSTGHADFVQTPGGEWWAVFLATRPYARDYYNTGRETFLLPVHWQDGWPTILPPNVAVPYTHPRPSATTPAPVDVPLTGNFTWRDDFADGALGRHWSLLREQERAWLRFNDGTLELRAKTESLASPAQPAFVGRRQQHKQFRAETRLRLPAVGVSAGLVAFQNETHHYFFGVRNDGALPAVFIERAAGAEPERLVEMPLEAGTAVDLAIEVDRDKIRFAVAIADGDWQEIAADLDATVLSTAVAGGFVGTMVGLHARSEPGPDSGPD